jgi:hypothetical protein
MTRLFASKTHAPTRATNLALYTNRNRSFRAIVIVALGAAIIASGCSGETADTAPPTVTTQPAVDVSCEDMTGLFPVDQVRNQEGRQCGQWLEQAVGRAIQGSTGSASVWSRQTPHGTALVVGAIHTLGEGWFGTSGTQIEEALEDPGQQIGVARLFLTLADGTGPDALATPLFRLYNPDIAAERNGNRMQDVLPREDFFVGVADSQKISVVGPMATPEPIVLEPIPLFDPAAATIAEQTWAEATAGALVLSLGYPNETGVLTASVGRVLDDAEAVAAIAMLAEVGDSEGGVPYEADVEMVIEGAAVAGMSGGPVVDLDGRLVGVLVRASDEHDGLQYVRAVRMSYVTTRLAEAFAALSNGEQAAIGNYLER